MIVIIAIFSVVGFLVAFWFLRVLREASAATTTALNAINVISDNELDDRVKEATARKASVELAIGFVSIAVRSAGSVIAAAVPILAADKLGIAPASDVIGFLSRWDVIVVCSAIFGGAYFVVRRIGGSRE